MSLATRVTSAVVIEEDILPAVMIATRQMILNTKIGKEDSCGDCSQVCAGATNPGWPLECAGSSLPQEQGPHHLHLVESTNKPTGRYFRHARYFRYIDAQGAG